jgi:cytochrome c-type biogenesis protein CcmH
MNSVPVFWALALALIALTLLVLLWPLLGPRRAREPSEAAARAAIYRDQKRQLDDDQAAGVITPAEHEAGVAELTRRLGLELDTSPEATAQAPQRSGWIAALVAVAVIPVGAIVVYLALGSPEALRPQAANEARPNEQQIVAMVETLAARMKANPSDPKGWRLLGRSFAALGRYAEAADAYEQASQHGDDDADLFADWAEALAMAHNRTIAGEPEALAGKALARDAGNVKAMALLATAAFERRDFDQSIDFWRRVQARFPPGSEDAKQAAAAVAEVERARQQAGTPAATA